MITFNFVCIRYIFYFSKFSWHHTHIVHSVSQVLHSQRLREKPLQPWIIAEKAGTVCTAHCDCMAGLGEACTHIATLLFAIDTTVKIRDSKTVTQEPAYWLLPATHREVRYREVGDIDFTSALTKKKEIGRSNCHWISSVIPHSSAKEHSCAKSC